MEAVGHVHGFSEAVSLAIEETNDDEIREQFHVFRHGNSPCLQIEPVCNLSDNSKSKGDPEPMQAYINTGDAISRSEFPCILAT
jgi:hypothetical protein